MKLKLKPYKLSILLLLGLGLTEIQAQSIIVREASSAISPYELTNIQKMTFSEGNINIHKKDNITISYSLDGLHISFDNLLTNIEDTKGIRNKLVFRAYPNPCNNIINISDFMSNGTYFIYNMDGRLIQSEKATSAINVGELSNGAYFLTIAGENNTQTIKFIKR